MCRSYKTTIIPQNVDKTKARTDAGLESEILILLWKVHELVNHGTAKIEGEPSYCHPRRQLVDEWHVFGTITSTSDTLPTNNGFSVKIFSEKLDSFSFYSFSFPEPQATFTLFVFLKFGEDICR
ncbi:MAG: hypothetical protein WC791_03465 [Candidatus Paceibacterota bacterium]|jgi:hypothetical protein